MEKIIEELEEAKKNVLTLLEEPGASVDFHGIVYWAGRVESLRELAKSLIK